MSVSDPTTQASSARAAESDASISVRRLATEDPTRLFVEDPADPLSYAELNRGADAVAIGLLDRLGPGEHPVPIRAATFQSVAVALLGVIRAGMVPVIQDRAVPRSRMALIVADLGAQLMLSDVEDVDDASGGYEGLTVERPRAFGRPPRPGELNVPPASISTIAYTSGSTGMPKGIIQPAASRESMAQLRVLLGDIDGARLPWLGATTWADAWVHIACVVGATVIPYDLLEHGTGALGGWLRDNRIAAVGTVPTLLRALVASLSEDELLPDLRIVVLSGESLQWRDAGRMMKHLSDDAMLFNMFGLTETGGLTVNLITKTTPIGEGVVPPGMILPSADVTIVGEDGREVAQGEAGEIMVVSATAGVGYWNRPDLTEAIFTVMPDGRRRVRTGDGGRILEDGTLQHLGRLDHVVKISGHRVELGEIEVTLRGIAGVDDAAAVAIQDAAGDSRLAAFVTATDASALSRVGMRSQLKRTLPAYMVPDRIEILSDLPRTANGKVDRVALAARPIAPIGPDETEPSSVIAARVVTLSRLWAEVLSLPSVGPDDNFFDLGGDSIRASRLLVKLERELGVDRPVSMLVESPTPALMAEALAEWADAWDELLPVQIKGSRAPLIVVHDGGGEAMYALGLAERFGEDQPIYGLRSPALSGRPPVQSSLPELAAHYIELVRRVAPSGPYTLYGSSLGGIIAFEMALQLQAAGEQVPVLAMGDTWLPDDDDGDHGLRGLVARVMHGQLGEAERQVVEHLRWRRENAVGTQFTQPRLAETEALRASGAHIPADLRREFATLEHGRLMAGYVPAAQYRGSVLLLRARGPHRGRYGGWDRYSTELPTIVDVDAAHSELGTGEGVPVIVGPLSRALGLTLMPAAPRASAAVSADAGAVTRWGRGAVRRALSQPPIAHVGELVARRVGHRWPAAPLTNRLRYEVNAALVARGATRRVATLVGGAQLEVQLEDVSSQRIYYHCGRQLNDPELYEPETTRFVLRWLRPGDTFIDLGANLGYFSMIAGRRVGPTGACYGFEPTAWLGRAFERSVALNRMQRWVHLVPLAVSDHSGTIDFFRPVATANGAQASTVAGAFGGPVERESIGCTTLDDFIESADISAIRLIKIDVEGAEQAVLAGASRMLATLRPEAIVLEFAPEMLADPAAVWQGLTRTMSAAGYRGYLLGPSGDPVRLNGPPKLGVQNVCFLPRAARHQR